MKKLPSYYWDTGMFLMLLAGNDQSSAEHRSVAARIIDLVQARKAVVVTSQVTVAEILPSYHPATTYERFLKWLKLENLYVQSMDHPVAVRVAEVREILIAQNLSAEKRYWADILHATTALLYERQLDIVHSTDDDVKRIYTAAGGQLQVEGPSYLHLPQEYWTAEEKALSKGQVSLRFSEAVSEVSGVNGGSHVVGFAPPGPAPPDASLIREEGDADRG